VLSFFGHAIVVRLASADHSGLTLTGYGERGITLSWRKPIVVRFLDEVAPFNPSENSDNLLLVVVRLQVVETQFALITIL
jgi:hypothetical protein